ncbi:helix-turn-helix transcriptional regulator [Aquisalimonas lutea]|uniref:helix-turn-helix transcriptional regulator n=1 Tax=Aquisalimonas lutea TaxID=1327750 RepID=UPI0025B30C76|nr:helix-turn-helix transcriptional regulator [Aquisalimonas lutea]MDN3518239.1 helix-turn-helix transcriptional regulator [Aquisalimonas lutea]
MNNADDAVPSAPPGGREGFLAAVAHCIDALREPGFEERLLALLRRVAASEQCMIFAYTEDDRVACLLAANERDPGLADVLARRYVDGAFRRDPNYALLRGQLHAGEPSVRPRRMATEAMAPDYRSHFFSFPDLVDKVSLSVPGPETVYYLNLYRGSDDGPFSDADIASLNEVAPLLASLVRRHYAPVAADRGQASPEEMAVLAHLSEREQQVCLCLLRGHTVKTAARELDVAASTVETYRKRAYAKLGVPSRARLIALCRH